MTNGRECDERGVYQIRLQGHLDEEWYDWFGRFAVFPRADDENVLTDTVADQAALHGLLANVRDLGLPLLSVERVDKE